MPYTQGHDFPTKRSSKTPVQTSKFFRYWLKKTGARMQQIRFALSMSSVRNSTGNVQWMFIPTGTRQFSKTMRIARIQYSLAQIHDVAAGVQEYTSSLKHPLFRRKKRTRWLTSRSAFPMVEYVFVSMQCDFRDCLRSGGLSCQVRELCNSPETCPST